MQLLDFIELIKLKERSEVERAKYLCYFSLKENSEEIFTMNSISYLFSIARFNKPNVSRLKTKLLKGPHKIFLCPPKKPNMFIFIPTILQELDRELGDEWNDPVTIVSNSELLDEIKFCKKRSFLDQLIKQINFTYANNCYDACAVLMRRLFEVLLILSYQHLNIENDITNAQGDHYTLDKIVKDATQNRKLNLPSRMRKHLDSFRQVGNLSAHNITYTAGLGDIDNIKLNYRVMVEELYNKAGLL